MSSAIWWVCQISGRPTIILWLSWLFSNDKYEYWPMLNNFRPAKWLNDTEECFQWFLFQGNVASGQVYRYRPQFRTGTTLSCPVPAHITKGPSYLQTGKFLLTIKYCRPSTRCELMAMQPTVDVIVFDSSQYVCNNDGHCQLMATVSLYKRIVFAQLSIISFLFKSMWPSKGSGFVVWSFLTQYLSTYCQSCRAELFHLSWPKGLTHDF